MSVKIKSVKLMSLNYKARKNISQFQCGFSGISDPRVRLVDNCLKMTAHDVIGGIESNSKAVILDA